MTKVRELVEQKKREKEADKLPKLAVSVRVSGVKGESLSDMAKVLGMSVTALATQLLEAAIDDAAGEF